MTFSSLDRARTLADAVLFEGYLLYPYRATSTKNQYRWTFGVLAPRGWSEAGGSDPWSLRAELLVESRQPTLRVRLRFLHVVEKRVEEYVGGRFRGVECLDVDGEPFVSCEEAEGVEVDVDVSSGGITVASNGNPPARLRAAVPSQGQVSFVSAWFEQVQLVHDVHGTLVGRVVRSRRAIEGAMLVHVRPISPALSKLEIDVENRTPHPSALDRRTTMRSSLVSAHLLVASEQDDLLSLLDPPPHAREAAATCRSVGTYPVLASGPGRRDVVLCAPIILPDHPEIAPESPQDLFDSTEIDEILTLRTRTLTQDEKRIARATDPRAAALLDRVEALSEEELLRLHGAPRNPSPARAIEPGARVRLRPTLGGRRADAQDFLLEGRCATVNEVLEDVDGRSYLAVTIDDDPAANFLGVHGRRFHFYPDEVETLEGGGE